MTTINHPDAAFYHSVAFGPHELKVDIAGHACTVKKNGPFTTVTDPQNTQHDFTGCKWAEVRSTMEERLQTWDHLD